MPRNFSSTQSVRSSFAIRSLTSQPPPTVLATPGLPHGTDHAPASRSRGQSSGDEDAEGIPGLHIISPGTLVTSPALAPTSTAASVNFSICLRTMFVVLRCHNKMTSSEHTLATVFAMQCHCSVLYSSHFFVAFSNSLSPLSNGTYLIAFVVSPITLQQSSIHTCCLNGTRCEQICPSQTACFLSNLFSSHSLASCSHDFLSSSQ